MLQLNRYKDAVQYCSRAISLNPNYRYAYNTRAEAYEALGETEKANQDKAKAQNCEYNYTHSSVHSTLQLQQYLFGLLGALLLSGGLIGLRKKGPLFISKKMLIAFISIIFFTATCPMISFFWSDEEFLTDKMKFISLLTLLPYIGIITYLWRRGTEFSILGLKLKDFFKAFTAMLNEKNLSYTQEYFELTIPEKNIGFEVKANGYPGQLFIRALPSTNEKALLDIFSTFKNYAKQNALPLERKVYYIAILFGCFVLAFCLIYSNWIFK